MNNLFKRSIQLLLIASSMSSFAQNTKRVLFLGNSYTSANNLPQLISDMASSTGRTLIFDSNTPGGYYLAQHLTNVVSLEKIANGNWDNVILQDQSLALAYPSTYNNFLPYAIELDSIIKGYNSCSQTMFYATWGRKNGDTYLCTPPECPVDTWINRTYYEMDSTIGAHYKFFADSIKSSMTPVGATWRHIRQNYPSIELFDSDGSHPSLAGSYAAACAFYTTLFRSDPTLIAFNSGLSATDATNIKNTVKQLVFDDLLLWNVGVYDYLLESNCLNVSTGHETPNDKYWSVFPNPVNDVLCVQFSANDLKDKLSIYNITGKLIQEIEVAQSTDIYFNEFSSGVYFIKSMNNPQTFIVIKNE